MKKLIMLLFLFGSLGTLETQAQYRTQQTIFGNDNNVYSDERGTYRYEVREQRVWVPERRTAGVFGIGSRTIPGHYEMRQVRTKVYTDQNRNGKKAHPHGMPPGQRKKLENNDGRYDRDVYDRDRNVYDRDRNVYDRDRNVDYGNVYDRERYERNSKGKSKKNK